MRISIPGAEGSSSKHKYKSRTSDVLLAFVIGILVGVLCTTIGFGLFGQHQLVTEQGLELQLLTQERDHLKVEMKAIESDVKRTFSGIQIKLKDSIEELQARLEMLDTQRNEAMAQTKTALAQRDACLREKQELEIQAAARALETQDLQREVKRLGLLAQTARAEAANGAKGTKADCGGPELQQTLREYMARFQADAQEQVREARIEAQGVVEQFKLLAEASQEEAEEMKLMYENCVAAEAAEGSPSCKHLLREQEEVCEANCNRQVEIALAESREAAEAQCLDEVRFAKRELNRKAAAVQQKTLHKCEAKLQLREAELQEELGAEIGRLAQLLLDHGISSGQADEEEGAVAVNGTDTDTEGSGRAGEAAPNKVAEDLFDDPW